MTIYVPINMGGSDVELNEDFKAQFYTVRDESLLESILDSNKDIKELTKNWSLFEKDGHLWFMPKKGYVITLAEISPIHSELEQSLLSISEELPDRNIFLKKAQHYREEIIYHLLSDNYVPNSTYIYLQEDSYLDPPPLRYTHDINGRKIEGSVDFVFAKEALFDKIFKNCLNTPTIQYSAKEDLLGYIERSLNGRSTILEEVENYINDFIESARECFQEAIESKIVQVSTSPSLQYQCWKENEDIIYEVETDIYVTDGDIELCYGRPRIIFSDGRSVYVKFPESDIPHPHVYSSGAACLGEYQDFLNKAAIEGDIDAMLQVMIVFLNSYNPDSAIVHPLDIANGEY